VRGRRKKESGGSPIEFLCSQGYYFWGLLIIIDEQKRPANKVSMKNSMPCPLDFRVESNACRFFILPLLAGLCCSSAVINNLQKLYIWLHKILLEIHQTLFSSPPHKKNKKGSGHETTTLPHNHLILIPMLGTRLQIYDKAKTSNGKATRIANKKKLIPSSTIFHN